jgi:hypothetical protein
MGIKSQKSGEENERIAEKYLSRKFNCTILNRNETGFPDLLVLDNGRLIALYEVKGGEKKTHKFHPWQEELHQKLRHLGFKVGKIIVKDGKVQSEELR